MGQEEVVFEPVSGVVTFFKSVSTSSQSQHKYVDVDVDTYLSRHLTYDQLQPLQTNASSLKFSVGLE